MKRKRTQRDYDKDLYEIKKRSILQTFGDDRDRDTDERDYHTGRADDALRETLEIEREEG